LNCWTKSTRKPQENEMLLLSPRGEGGAGDATAFAFDSTPGRPKCISKPRLSERPDVGHNGASLKVTPRLSTRTKAESSAWEEQGSSLRSSPRARTPRPWKAASSFVSDDKGAADLELVPRGIE
jgi:hypothetical protein